MKLRITLIDGTALDMDTPQPFDMAAFVSSIRAMGYMIGPGIYIPAEQICMMLVMNGENPVIVGMTKQ